MKVGVLFSGGKDSTYAAYLAKQRGEDVSCLITILPLRDDSWMFHYPNLQWTRLQSEAMRVPQTFTQTKGVKEEELEDLRSALATAKRDYSIEAVYTGALASQYQKVRVETLCSGLGLGCVSPLWSIDPEVHLRNLVRHNFSVIFTGVAALGLDESWLGRQINGETIAQLVELGKKYHFHIGLEGGEGETFVLDCPIFDRRIELISAEKLWRGDSGFLLIKDARLVGK